MIDRILTFRPLAAALLPLLAVLATSCSKLQIESQPAGAQVVWSATGLDPWRSWPPNSWEFEDRSTGSVTPMNAQGVYGDVIFVTVEKPGYRRPLPRVVELFPFTREKLVFELEELPETFEARMREEGFINFRGSWVKPEEEGLEQYADEWMTAEEAFEARQRAAGLIEYMGDWLTPEEATRREAADMRAKGLVQHKGRWISPEAAQEMAAIDAEVAAVREAGEYEDLDAPRVVGRNESAAATIQLINSTSQPTAFLLSGPVSRRIIVEPYGAQGVRTGEAIPFEPGRYEIAVVPGAGESAERLRELLGEDADSLPQPAPLWGSWPLAPGMEYSLTFSGGRASLQDRLDQLELQEPESTFRPPNINVRPRE